MSDDLQKSLPIPGGVFHIRNKKSQKVLGLTSINDIIAQTQTDSDLQKWTINERGPVIKNWAKYSICNLGNRSYFLGYKTDQDKVPEDKTKIERIETSLIWTIWKDMDGVFKVGTVTPTTTLLMEHDTGSDQTLIKEESGSFEQQWELIVVQLGTPVSFDPAVPTLKEKLLTDSLPTSRSLTQRTTPPGWGLPNPLPGALWRFENVATRMMLTSGPFWDPIGSTCLMVISKAPPPVPLPGTPPRPQLIVDNVWRVYGGTGGVALSTSNTAFDLTSIPINRFAGRWDGRAHTNRRPGREAWYLRRALNPPASVFIGTADWSMPGQNLYVLRGENSDFSYVPFAGFNENDPNQRWRMWPA